MSQLFEVFNLRCLFDEEGPVFLGSPAEVDGHCGSGIAVDIDADAEVFADGLADGFEIGDAFADGADRIDDISVGGDEGGFAAGPAFVLGLEPGLRVGLWGIAAGMDIHLNAITGATSE